MKSRKDFKKRNANFSRNQEEDIRIKAIKKQPKKINKKNYHLMIEDDDDDLEINLYDYEDDND